jgi:hypothetical protein
MTGQLCPKCKGQGIVSRPPWIPADQPTWVSHTLGPYRCNLCDGMKVIDLDSLPFRGSDVEVWLKGHRELAGRYGDRQGWLLLDSILDDYRLRADMGRSLRDDLDSEGVA